ncbi:MAG: methylated-DNA--[protein]-cysteine S-methyltransferase [Rhodobacteraceae bacterium]|nr:methylated-DNA--[protein]-cysteine S-methyltransferase [Paracoccaceae bacterium]
MSVAQTGHISIDSPFGRLTVWRDGRAITRLDWTGLPPEGADDLLARAAQQLQQYFAGTRQDFDLPLAPAGSALQLAVCDAMSAIAFGETRTYGDIARDLGVSAQAVGQACGGNPIAIIIPCHRVLAADGLGGFSARGGVETKVALLKHEGAASLLI